jgi:hypothetical protein
MAISRRRIVICSTFHLVECLTVIEDLEHLVPLLLQRQSSFLRLQFCQNLWTTLRQISKGLQELCARKQERMQESPQLIINLAQNRFMLGGLLHIIYYNKNSIKSVTEQIRIREDIISLDKTIIRVQLTNSIDPFCRRDRRRDQTKPHSITNLVQNKIMFGRILHIIIILKQNSANLSRTNRNYQKIFCLDKTIMQVSQTSL